MMIRPTASARGLALATLGAASLWVTADRWVGFLSATDAYEPQPTQSGPIAITSDDRFVWSVNPDNNSV